MLVLSRKPEESVVIGRPNTLERILKITVLAIRGGKVQLGFEAGIDLPVHRSEVWERIRTNGEQTALPEKPAVVS